MNFIESLIDNFLETIAPGHKALALHNALKKNKTVDTEIKTPSYSSYRYYDSKTGTSKSSAQMTEKEKEKVLENYKKDTESKNIDITGTPEYKKLLADQAAANKRIEAQNKNIEDLIATIEDLRRPRSAQEMAKHYGVTLDEAQFLKERNEATNKYYDEATGYQNKLRNQYVRNTAGQYDNMYNRYLDTYQNAAPTASGKGIRAANLLSSALQGQQYMQNVDQGMLESVNDLEAARKKEIANNPNVAAQEYADLAAYLTQAGMNANAADVKGYAAAIKAASDMTLSNRQYAAQLAQNQATRYQGLANAAGTRASSAANSNNLWDQLYSWYQGIYGNKKDASNALLNYANVSNNITK